MSAREIIAKTFHEGSPYGADDIADRTIEALTAAGYRIIGPGEYDAETLERAANLAADLKKRAHYEQIVLYHHAKAAHDIVEALKGGAR